MRPKIGQLLFGQLMWRKIIFFQFFLKRNELHISKAFQEHQTCLIPASYEPMVKFCLKRVLNSFFLYFLKSSYIHSCGWNCPRVEEQGAKKEVCFVHRILVFHIFHLFCFAYGFAWCHLQFDCYNLDVKFLNFFLQEIIQGPWSLCWSFGSRPPLTKIILAYS